MVELIMTERVTADLWTGGIPPPPKKKISEAPSFVSPYSLHKDHHPYHHGHLVVIREDFWGTRVNFQRLIKITLSFADVHNAQKRF